MLLVEQVGVDGGGHIRSSNILDFNLKLLRTLWILDFFELNRCIQNFKILSCKLQNNDDH